MHKCGKVVSLPVICACDGKQIGIVENVIFCPKKREVKAFLLERKGYEVHKRIIMFKDVLSIGNNALIVNDSTCAIPLKKAELSQELKDKGEIRGLRIFTKSGEDLGIAKDVLFDFSTGIIEGVEISDGLLQDILYGRKILPLFGKVEFSEEYMLVDKEAVEEMASTGGGISRRLLKKGKE